jgi:hypothetical protein
MQSVMIALLLMPSTQSLPLAPHTDINPQSAPIGLARRTPETRGVSDAASHGGFEFAGRDLHTPRSRANPSSTNDAKALAMGPWCERTEVRPGVAFPGSTVLSVSTSSDGLNGVAECCRKCIEMQCCTHWTAVPTHTNAESFTKQDHIKCNLKLAAGDGDGVAFGVAPEWDAGTATDNHTYSGRVLSAITTPTSAPALVPPDVSSPRDDANARTRHVAAEKCSGAPRCHPGTQPGFFDWPFSGQNTPPLWRAPDPGNSQPASDPNEDPRTRLPLWQLATGMELSGSMKAGENSKCRMRDLAGAMRRGELLPAEVRDRTCVTQCILLTCA